MSLHTHEDVLLRGRTHSRDPSNSTSKTKWAGNSSRYRKFGTNELDTIISGHLTQEQLAAYQQYFRIEEISDVLRVSAQQRRGILSILPSGNLEQNPNFHRDPSPPPKYDNQGNRTNTREERTRVALETERHYLVEVATKAIPNFIAPFDYRKPVKNTEKLYVPAKDYPDINFMGLLLGPRGNTLKQLREQSGAILQIRGKGSVKDGKSVSSNDDEETNGAVAFSNPTLTSNADELHVLITADSQQKIAKAIKLTNEVIEKAISSPVGQNDLKRGQLRELAILNGTFRETKPYVPQEERQRPQIDISQIVCKICGNVGHFARDCKMGNNRNENNQNNYSNNSNNYSNNNNNGNNNYNNNYNNYNNNYTNSQNQNDYNKFPSSGAKHHLDGSAEDLPPWKKNKPNIPLPPWQNAPVQTASETLGSLPPPPTVSGFVPPVSHIPPPPSVRLPPPPINNTSRAPPPPVGAKPVPSGAKPPPPPGSKPPPPLDVKPPPPDVKPPPPPANRPPPPPTNT